MCQGFVFSKACTCSETDQNRSWVCPGLAIPVSRPLSVVIPLAPCSLCICNNSDDGCSQILSWPGRPLLPAIVPRRAALCHPAASGSAGAGQPAGTSSDLAVLTATSPLFPGILRVSRPPELLQTCRTSDWGGGARLELRSAVSPSGAGAADGGCATPSLALALLVPQSCRFQVALWRGKDSPQGCLRAAC